MSQIDYLLSLEENFRNNPCGKTANKIAKIYVVK